MEGGIYKCRITLYIHERLTGQVYSTGKSGPDSAWPATRESPPVDGERSGEGRQGRGQNTQSLPTSRREYTGLRGASILTCMYVCINDCMM